MLYRVLSPVPFKSPARLHRTHCYLNSGSHFCVGQVCGLWLADPQPQPCLCPFFPSNTPFDFNWGGWRLLGPLCTTEMRKMIILIRQIGEVIHHDRGKYSLQRSHISRNDTWASTWRDLYVFMHCRFNSLAIYISRGIDRLGQNLMLITVCVLHSQMITRSPGLVNTFEIKIKVWFCFLCPRHQCLTQCMCILQHLS